MKRLLRSLTIAAVLTTLWIAPSHAGSLLQKQMDFLGTTPGGSMSLVSGGSMLVNNAIINSVEAFPSFKTVKISSGTLDFATGTCKSGCFTTINKKTGTASTTPFFNWGGHLSITGYLPGMDKTLPVQSLLYGTFSPIGLAGGNKNGATVPSASLSSATHRGSFNGSLLISQINPEIYTDFLPYIFQIPSGTGRSYLSEMLVNVSFASSGPVFQGFKQPGTWNGSVLSTDIIVKPTPEPSALFLFALVLLVGAGLLRRRVNFAA